jgi:ribosomal protein L16 Arg81 hydroxylase
VPGDPASFELRWGPLTARDVRTWLAKPASAPNEIGTRSRRRETLVVNDVDRFHPPLADWMRDAFRFLPGWRMDDGQISLAGTGGGIGPHVDDYDVFLIQMAGSRTWEVGRRKIGALEERDMTIDGMDVRVLRDWDSDDDGEDGRGMDKFVDEFVVRPGDALYLPPRVAHCGTSLSDDCMTLSVGCRAPSVSDLVSKLAERLSSSIDDCAVRRYADPDLLRGVDLDASSGTTSPGELTSDAKERARLLVKDSLVSLIDDDEWWDEFFGRYVTEQKRARNNYPIPLEDSSREEGGDDPNINTTDDDEWGDAQSMVRSVLVGTGVLYQAEGIAFAHSSIPSKLRPGVTNHRFFVNGEMWQSEGQSDDETNSLTQLFRVVSNHRRLDRSLLLGLDRNDNQHAQHDELSSEAISFLEELVSAGVLYGASA